MVLDFLQISIDLELMKKFLLFFLELHTILTHGVMGKKELEP